MPRSMLARRFPCTALAGLLVFFAGCMPAPPPSAVARANLHNNAQDLDQIPVTASVTESGYRSNNAAGQGTYPPPNASQGNDSSQPYSQSSNGYPQPPPT